MTIKEYDEFRPVQRALGLKADGLPGPKTLHAVVLRLQCHEIWAAVQAAVGVDPDGVPGPKTAAAIAETLGIVMPVAHAGGGVVWQVHFWQGRFRIGYGGVTLFAAAGLGAGNNRAEVDLS